MGNNSLKTKSFYLLMFLMLDILSAQTLKLEDIPGDKLQFGFVFEKPFYALDRNLSTLSGEYQLSVNIPLSSKLNIIGKIPFINTSFDVDYGFDHFSYSRNGLGNIFIGLQTKPVVMESQRSIVTFGLFLPTADKEASYYGFSTDYYGIQKFVPNSFGIYFNYAYHKIKDEGFNYGFEIGPNVFIATEEGSGTELFMHYGVNTGYQINKLLLNIELLGIAIVSENIEEFGDRFVHTLDFGAQWKEIMVTPKIYYKIYLKEKLRESVDGVLGIGVSVSID